MITEVFQVWVFLVLPHVVMKCWLGLVLPCPRPRCHEVLVGFPLPLPRVENPLGQILLVVANTQMGTLRNEVGKVTWVDRFQRIG